MNLAVLGATGSIGASTLDVVSRHAERYRVFALSANGSADALLELCHISPSELLGQGREPGCSLADERAERLQRRALVKVPA